MNSYNKWKSGQSAKSRDCNAYQTEHKVLDSLKCCVLLNFKESY